MPLGALASIIDFTGVAEDEFRDWYDTEAFPRRQRIEGFLTASRWINRDNAKVSLGFYDLASIEVLDEEGYQSVAGDNFSPWSKRVLGCAAAVERYEAVQITPGDALSAEGAAALYMVGMNIPDAADEEFHRWYDEEHLPALAAVDGVLAARRYRTRHGLRRYLAFYHVEDPSIPGSPAWLEAAETPWNAKMVAQMTERFRAVFIPYVESPRS